MFGEDISVLYITLLKDENVWNTLPTVTYSCATPLNIGANLLLLMELLKQSGIRLIHCQYYF